MKGAQNPMRGIYRRGSIYRLARQVNKKRHFVSLETTTPAFLAITGNTSSE